MKIIRKENLAETAKSFDKLLIGIQKTPQVNLLIHRTSKILLKKKTEITDSWKDLRPITIMPAIYMVFDKIIMQGRKSSLKTYNWGQQNGAREGFSVTTAKMNIIYCASKLNMNHIMILDITKAFDTVDRHLLRKVINQKAKTTNAILANILNLYELINLQMDDTIIQPSTGIPQGSVFGPLLFLLYINQVLEKVQSALPNINIQAFVDDIIILARTKEELQKALDKTHQEIKNLNLTLNLNKCEYISTTKDPIIDPYTSKQIYPVETAK